MKRPFILAWCSVKHWKKPLIAALCFVLAIAIGITACIFYQKAKLAHAGEALYDRLYADFADFPLLPEEFKYSEFYYNDGDFEYLLLTNAGQELTAVRNNVGETTYFIQENAWQIIDGNLQTVDTETVSVKAHMEAYVRKLLTDANHTYRCDLPNDHEIPCYVFSEVPYLEIQRAENPDYHEFLSYKDGQICWDILKTTNDIKWYAYASEHTPQDIFAAIIGWDNIDKAMIEIMLHTQQEETK